MSGAQLVLAAASRVVVVVWIAVGLLWSAADPARPTPERVARLDTLQWNEPEPASKAPPAQPPETEAASEEPPPEPEAAPPEAAPPEAPPEPRAGEAPPTQQLPPEAPPLAGVEPGDTARGEPLLDGAGAFPPLEASYAEFGSFGRYARAMEALGARFVVVRARRIEARIDVASGSMGPIGGRTRFSPRARDYSGEPALQAAASAARARYGPRAEVMMLVPRSVDAALFGAIARELERRGHAASEIRSIQARYQPSASGGVALRVEAGRHRDGRALPLGLSFDLTRIAGAGGDARGA